MRRGSLASAALVLLAACGKGEPTPPTSTSPATPPAPPPASPGAGQEDLVKAVAAAKAAVKEAEAALDALVEKHTAEMAALGDLGMARDQMIRARRELARARADLAAYEGRLRSLEESVAGAGQEKLVALRKERDRLAEELSAAQSQRTRENVEAGKGRVDESPVAGELRALREVQRAWFLATARARARELPRAEKETLNREYRAWLAEKPERGVAAANALKGVKGGVEAFDVTSFAFFLRCQLREDALDRKNVEVERGALKATRDRIEAIYGEIDGVDERIQQLLQAEGGDELKDHEEAKRRVAVLRPRCEELQRQLDELEARLAPEAALRARQRENYAAAEAVAEEAKRALALAQRRLAGGR
ncbi:MAG: hypothetical protein ACT4PV_12560 [Planctomycetaceae bacterium]